MDFYGTIGPACADEETLRKMFELGMTGIRLNLSHVRLRDAAGQIGMIHKAAAATGVRAKLLIDMQGPELRIGMLPAPIELAEGDELRLGRGGIPVPPIVLPELIPGREVLLDDGKLLLRVTEGGAENCTAEVLRGGTLRSSKSIALPGVRLYPPAMTERDRESVKCAAEFGVTGVMQPFVRSAADLKELRAALCAAGAGHIKILAKIENLDGVENLEELIPCCDEIVIARGDLGNAVPLWELPALQKAIAEKCRCAGKPFMTVTQMLASMEHSSVPTRAEVSDIYNAVLDGSASLMVTGETAVGEYPAEVIRYLVNTAREAEKHLRQQAADA